MNSIANNADVNFLTSLSSILNKKKQGLFEKESEIYS